MKVFRELYIRVGVDAMAKAVARMEKNLPSGWTHDTGAESRASAAPPFRTSPIFCFACASIPNRPAAMLVLAEKDSNCFYVSNIVPIERYQLEPREYNAVLEDFHQQVVKPYCDSVKIEVEMTGTEAGLENWMDEGTADLLRNFSASANRGTLASHPNDRARWNEFVVSSQRTGSKLDPSTLSRWLVEAEEWPPVIAERLAIEYRSGREILSYADNR